MSLRDASCPHPPAENRSQSKPYVYTERTLQVSFIGDCIIKVDLTSKPDSLTEVKEGVKHKFELDIQWAKSALPHGPCGAHPAADAEE